MSSSKYARSLGMLRWVIATTFVAAIALSPGLRASGQPQGDRSGNATISPQAMAQIAALTAEKGARTAAERKIDSRLLYASRIAAGRTAAAGVTTLQVKLPMTADNRAILDVRAPVTDALLARLRALGAEIVDTSARHDHVGVRVGLDRVEAIAGIQDVAGVMPEYGAKTTTSAPPVWRQIGAPSMPERVRRKTIDRADLIAQLRAAIAGRSARVSDQGPITNVGTVTTQGDVTHRAAEARATFALAGTGVKIGVLSDGVDTLAASQATGNLGPVTVLAAGSGDEGTAMLEIVHDLAPGAQLYFATAFVSLTNFANNIQALRAAGCDIIIDDVLYFVETPFQDGQSAPSQTNGGAVIQAVKNVASTGAMYFSSAGNSGRLNAGTSGTWEGDFVDAGPAGGVLTGAGELHSFGPSTLNKLVAGGFVTTLNWADPLGASSNDYDVYLLDSTGTSIVDASTNFQTGTQDPIELMSGGAAGQQIVIAKFAGAARFLHLDTNGGVLTTGTGGEIHGHAATAAPNTFGVAATPACAGFGTTPPGPCTGSFTILNKVETFSSDGPRRVFYNASGVAFTPGNFSSTGGLVLNKPDITAADGVVTSVPGFNPFYGTSAAAPHAGAIAALVKSANLAQTAAQVSAALINTALDINSAGWDRDSGYGIVMAYQALGGTAAPPGAPPTPTGFKLTRTGPNSATASWNPSPGATSYTLRFSLTAGGLKSPLITFAGTSVNISGFVRGQTYFFVVMATNGSGSSVDTPEFLYLVPLTDTPADFDGDAHADLSVWRPGNGTFFWLPSSSNYNPAAGSAKQWGFLGDKPLSGDIDGDGKPDLVVWRPTSGTWFWLTSSTGYNYANQAAKQWGTFGDVPMLADLDGDGRDDLIVWRPSSGTWYWLTSSSGYNYASAQVKQWGTAGDTPLVGDFDGDHKADLAVWRGSTGVFYWLTSSSGYNYAVFGQRQWGSASLGDIPLLGDMDGDGRADLAVWRASSGTFFWITSSTGYSYASAGVKQWGSQALGDIPLLGDLDGDHKSDLVVWRPGAAGTWFTLSSSTGYNYANYLQYQWGTTGDVPLMR